jgi:hypothetical protein
MHGNDVTKAGKNTRFTCHSLLLAWISDVRGDFVANWTTVVTVSYWDFAAICECLVSGSLIEGSDRLLPKNSSMPKKQQTLKYLVY